jgi:putative acetyltransferase
MKVRKYQAEDLDAVLNCWQEASRIAHPFLSDDFLKQERFNIPNVYMPITETWVCESGAEVIGFISLLGNEVGAIFVKPKDQRSGAGHALMNKARDLRGQLVVDVFEANTIGIGFYKKYGFQPGATRMHEETGNTVLRMALSD